VGVGDEPPAAVAVDDGPVPPVVDDGGPTGDAVADEGVPAGEVATEPTGSEHRSGEAAVAAEEATAPDAAAEVAPGDDAAAETGQVGGAQLVPSEGHEEEPGEGGEEELEPGEGYVEEPEPRESDEEELEILKEWRRGPSFVLGYRYLGLYDWLVTSHGHALSSEIYPLARRVSWLRLGLGMDIILRSWPGHDDLLLRAYGTLGVQLPRRISPFVAFNAGGGVFGGRTFGQPKWHGLYSLGVDGGSSFRITRTFTSELLVGYYYWVFGGMGYHSFTFRVALGW
jgi:hypothetical protein